MTKDELAQQPLLIRLKRGVCLGRDPRTGVDVTGAPGDVIDAIDLQARGILTGFKTAESFAASVCFGGLRNPRAELVNPDDRKRLGDGVIRRG